MINTRINAVELKLLSYLHEHAAGYSAEFHFEGRVVAEAIGEPFEEVHKAASYLAGFELVAMFDRLRTRGGGMAPVYLTHLGENYMRVLEETMQQHTAVARGKKLGVSVLSELYKTSMDVLTKSAGAILSEYARRSTDL